MQLSVPGGGPGGPGGPGGGPGGARRSGGGARSGGARSPADITQVLDKLTGKKS